MSAPGLWPRGEAEVAAAGQGLARGSEVAAAGQGLARGSEVAAAGHGLARGSEVAAAGLLPLDRLEQRLEVAFAKALRAVPLDQLEEDRRPVLHRLGEDLQQVAV